MNDPTSADPLDNMLGPHHPTAPALEARLRRATSDVVRRRRYLRRAGQVVAGLVAVAAGVLAVWLVVRQPRREESVQVPAPAPPPARAPEPVAPPTALALEWQAFDSKDERPAQYFRAGDQYLEAEGDYAAALRCYTQALASCTADDLEFAENDNWLVLALKEARRREMRHE